jgi:hypothetical protein
VQPVREKIASAQTGVDTEIVLATAAQTAIAKAKSLVAGPSLNPQSSALSAALTDASGSVSSLILELSGTQAALKDSQTVLTTVEQKVGHQTDDLNTCGDDKNKALDRADALEKKSAIDAKKYHRLKFAVCLLAAALATFVAVRLGLLKLLAFLGPYGMLGIAAIPAAVFGALWFVL